jgi:DNA-directed RNA polymerase specialized sigma subunit
VVLRSHAWPARSSAISRRWQIHVKRPAKELAMEVRAVIGQLTQELRWIPSELDLARYLGASTANLREARLAELAFRPSPLDVPLSGQPGVASLADRMGGEDPRIEIYRQRSDAARRHRSSSTPGWPVPPE